MTMKIIERHEPRYNVETKVAAPVYILPKHGPVVDGARYPLEMPSNILPIRSQFSTSFVY